jgi:hypothetical protein
MGPYTQATVVAGEPVSAPDLIDQNFGERLAVVIAVDALVLFLSAVGVFTG